jgi:putative DNA primase/helicase
MSSNNTVVQTQKTLHYAATDPHQLASRFLRRHGRDPHGHLALRYWRDEFWRFHQGRYQKVSYAELQAKMSEFVRDEFQREKPTTNNGRVLQVTRSVVGNVMQALMGKVLVESHLEQPIWLGDGQAGPFFIFANGMINADDLIRANQPRITPHCGNWFTQTTFPYDYEAAATSPRWLAFLNEVLEQDQERIALLQQWFGYCLTADTTQQRFVVAVGEGENGKSVVLDLLTAMLGPENVSHVRVELFAQRFQLTMTLGKLANISYDTGEIDESAEATIKEFTGGDRMYFDRKGVPGVFAYPTARLILATNHDPRFADRSKGIWRRMIVIPFRVSIHRDRQDPYLASKLKAELPGIFNWSLDGLRELRRHGQFAIPSVCQQAWEEYKRESNPARQFLTESFETNAEGTVLCATIYEDYTQWCSERGFRPLDDTKLGKELRKVFPGVERRRDTSGERRWRYCGLRAIGGTAAVSVPVTLQSARSGD